MNKFRVIPINLDITRSNRQITIQGIRQGDNLSYQLQIHLLNKGKRIKPSNYDTAVATMFVVKADEKIIIGDTNIVYDTICYDLTVQDTAVAGISIYQLELSLQTKNDDDTYTTETLVAPQFQVQVNVSNRVNIVNSVDDFQQYTNAIIATKNLIGIGSQLQKDVEKRQLISNMISDVRYADNPNNQYPSLTYLFGYYYDCEEIDSKISEKANTIEVNAALAKLSNNITLEVGHKQTAYYETDTITTIEDLIALNGSKAVYSGVMSGFSTVFGQSSDDKYIGFRMWFMRRSSNTTSTDRFILLHDGSIWYAGNASSTLFRQLTYSKTQVDNLLDEKQNVQYLTDTVTTIDDFTAYNQTNTVYTGRMQGFSTKFGELSDTAVKGFRMWFVLSGSDNPTWYRIVLFDDGAIWTATRSSATFTQRSYTKKQVDNLLADKADLDAYKNVIFISNQISSAGALNQFFANKNKTYVFTAIPPLSNDLNVTPTSQFELHNYENYQILRAIGHPNKSDGNKTFIRVYNEAENKWDNVADCTLPDNYITKAKLSADLSAEISGKYDASNIETGSGEFTTTSVRINSANFEYQKVGDYVTVNIFASFAESSMGATTSIQLAGMPFTNESSGTLRLPCATSKKTGLIVALGKNTINILTSEAVTFSADETMGVTITYKITKTNGG